MRSLRQAQLRGEPINAKIFHAGGCDESGIDESSSDEGCRNEGRVVKAVA